MKYEPSHLERESSLCYSPLERAEERALFYRLNFIYTSTEIALYINFLAKQGYST